MVLAPAASVLMWQICLQALHPDRKGSLGLPLLRGVLPTATAESLSKNSDMSTQEVCWEWNCPELNCDMSSLIRIMDNSEFMRCTELAPVHKWPLTSFTFFVQQKQLKVLQTHQKNGRELGHDASYLLVIKVSWWGYFIKTTKFNHLITSPLTHGGIVLWEVSWSSHVFYGAPWGLCCS